MTKKTRNGPARKAIAYDEKGLSRPMTIREFAEASGLDYEAIVIKGKLADAIKAHCRKNEISQRKLAAMVPGLSQDRVSKLFNSLAGGGMTIDKLITIASALKLEVKVEIRSRAA